MDQNLQIDPSHCHVVTDKQGSFVMISQQPGYQNAQSGFLPGQSTGMPGNTGFYTEDKENAEDTTDHAIQSDHFSDCAGAAGRIQQRQGWTQKGNIQFGVNKSTNSDQST